MNAIPLINNIPKTNINNEKQLRQEINTSLVALKKEAGTLEGLINEAAQMLVTINNRIATLENDTVKKSDIVDVVQSGNLQPVTSNAVASAIDKINYSASARNIDTLYPSENGKSEVFGGRFSGNVPESIHTAILKTFRISSTYSSNVHIYQEWETFGASIPYNPNKYFRFGYFTGSASPTWTDWQKVIRAYDLGGSALKYKDITFTIADMTFNHITTSGRDFWYCSIPKNQHFTDNQIIISTMIVFWNGISPIIAQIDGDGTSLSFQYWDNNFASGAYIKVRYLYLEL